LNEGKIAEMKTGEGKTLAALLPSFLSALSGKGTHVITVNDYLAKRDSHSVGQVHRFLGLTVGLVQSEMVFEDRRKNYNCDIVYLTNNVLGFDYLRDNMVLKPEEIVQKPFFYCIVDEVDSILIDEARTPLIISGIEKKINVNYILITNLVQKFKKGFHYLVDEKNQNIIFTAEGVLVCEQVLAVVDLYSTDKPLALPILNAIKAKELFQRNKHYIVGEDDQIIIVDEFTGRTMIGRRWGSGLHQALEAKEKLPVRKEMQTLASISYQNLFLLYKVLSGMTGTANTEDREFKKIYNLIVVPIPTKSKVQRKDLADLIYGDRSIKWRCIAQECLEMNKIGRPVLIGTTTIEKSELLAALLDELVIVEANLKLRSNPRSETYRLLNAQPENIRSEAEIIAQSGCKDAITISTNLAGRGTDILLGGNATFLTNRLISDIIERKDFFGVLFFLSFFALHHQFVLLKTYELNELDKKAFCSLMSFAKRLRGEHTNRWGAKKYSKDKTTKLMKWYKYLFIIAPEAGEPATFGEQRLMRNLILRIKQQRKSQEASVVPLSYLKIEEVVSRAIKICPNSADVADRIVCVCRGVCRELERTIFLTMYELLLKAQKQWVKRNKNIVIQLGGLHVLGTDKHESRRIDNQLRGRAGRQGDPGSSRFFLSLDDRLLRIFGRAKIRNVTGKAGSLDMTPLQNEFLYRNVEKAQIKVESLLFDERRQLFEYDQVLSSQRVSIYSERRKVLELSTTKSYIASYVYKVLRDFESGYFWVKSLQYLNNELPRKEQGFKFRWFRRTSFVKKIKGLAYTNNLQRRHVWGLFGEFFPPVLGNKRTCDWLFYKAELLFEGFILKRSSFSSLYFPEITTYSTILNNTSFYFEHQIGISYCLKEVELEVIFPGISKEIDKICLLKTIDRLWINHLERSANLQESVKWVCSGQKDPLVEYKKEAFYCYKVMLIRVRHRVLYRLLFKKGIFVSK
jgi:preprotein translocase subunit SecA